MYIGDFSVASSKSQLIPQFIHKTSENASDSPTNTHGQVVIGCPSDCTRIIRATIELSEVGRRTDESKRLISLQKSKTNSKHHTNLQTGPIMFYVLLFSLKKTKPAC